MGRRVRLVGMSPCQGADRGSAWHSVREVKLGVNMGISIRGDLYKWGTHIQQPSLIGMEAFNNSKEILNIFIIVFIVIDW